MKDQPLIGKRNNIYNNNGASDDSEQRNQVISYHGRGNNGGTLDISENFWNYISIFKDVICCVKNHDHTSRHEQASACFEGMDQRDKNLVNVVA